MLATHFIYRGVNKSRVKTAILYFAQSVQSINAALLFCLSGQYKRYGQETEIGGHCCPLSESAAEVDRNGYCYCHVRSWFRDSCPTQGHA